MGVCDFGLSAPIGVDRVDHAATVIGYPAVFAWKGRVRLPDTANGATAQATNTAAARVPNCAARWSVRLLVMPLPFSAGQGKGRMNTPPRASANNDGIVTPSQGLCYRPNGPAGSMQSSENPIYANFSELRQRGSSLNSLSTHSGEQHSLEAPGTRTPTSGSMPPGSIR